MAIEWLELWPRFSSTTTSNRWMRPMTRRRTRRTATRSSGAHLAGVAATTALPVKGYLLGSGMYDLRGPRLSKRSSYVRFTDAVEDALSPQRHVGRVTAPIAIVYGSLETPEFQRQSRDF